MKRLYFVPAVALLVSLGILREARAEQLDLKEVAADATWLGHVDFDALRASSVVRKFWQHLPETHPDAKKHIDFVSGLLGMDPRKDLHGVTFYGKDLGKPAGVLIVHAKFDRQRLLSIAEKGPNHQVAKRDGYELHSWRFERGDHPQTVVAAFDGPGRIVVASGSDDLMQAMNVLPSKSPSLKRDAPLSGHIPPGTSVLFRAHGVARSHAAEKSRLAKQTESFRFVLGEDQGRSFFRARAVMNTDDVVQKLKAVIEGARALASLHVAGDKQAERLVDGLRVKVDASTLTVLWSASADDVWAVVQKHAKLLADWHAKHEAWRRHVGESHQRPATRPVPPEEDF